MIKENCEDKRKMKTKGKNTKESSKVKIEKYKI